MVMAVRVPVPWNLAEAERQALAEVKACQSRLKFLRIEFDKELAESNDPRPDVKIYVQDRTRSEPILAHKLILACKSPVFCRMFDSKMLEDDTGTVRIDDVTFPVMRAVIKFCYEAEVEFSAEVTGEDVLPVAHKYGIDFLKTVCEEHLVKSITKGNLSNRLKLARKFGAKTLQHGIMQFLKSHFDEAVGVIRDELF